METGSRSSRLARVVFAGVALGSAGLVVACSGSGTSAAALFEPNGPDAGGETAPDLDAGTPALVSDAGTPTLVADTGAPVVFNGDGGGSLFQDASVAVCTPGSVASYVPTWKQPNASASGACTSAQIATYYDACLGSTATSAGCAAFSAASADNQTCTSCLATDDTASQYGPVIWHDNRLFYTTNIAGCITDEQKDLTATGCGASYQALITCKEQACSTCLSAQNPNFTSYATCENNAGTECEAYLKTLEAACGTALTDASSPAFSCIPPSIDTAQEAYLRLATVFCGP